MSTNNDRKVLNSIFNPFLTNEDIIEESDVNGSQYKSFIGLKKNSFCFNVNILF
jgi:hypothetical protein